MVREVAKGTTFDGEYLLSGLSREASGAPHESLFWRSGGHKTLLAGDWKLQKSGNPHTQWLYELRNDPTERSDQA